MGYNEDHDRQNEFERQAKEPGKHEVTRKANKPSKDPLEVLYILWVILAFFIGGGCYLLTMVILEAISFATVGHPLPRFVYYLPIIGIMGASKSADSPSFGAWCSGFAMSGVIYYLSMMAGC